MKCIKYYEQRYLLLLVVMMLLSACASTPPKIPSIEERATARWDMLFSGDLAGAYEFLSPGYRSSVSSLQYQRSILLKQVRWISAEYKSSDCEETTCKVKFLLEFRVVGALPGVKSYVGSMDIEELWILIDGLWYLVPEQ